MILAYIPLFIGIIFLLTGTLIKLNQNKINTNSILINGRIVDNVRRVSTTNNSYSVLYYPVFEFTYCEKLHTIEYSIGTSRPRFSTNQIVQLKYNPEYPNKVLLANDNLTKYF